jgi:peptidoglycan/LPS O-acetylase OafA/YrhL
MTGGEPDEGQPDEVWSMDGRPAAWLRALAPLFGKKAAPSCGAAATHAGSMSKISPHFPSLDGLRTVSFLLVFLAHSGLQDRVPGGFGVTTFFFLSGFLITSLMRFEETRTGTVSLKNFYLRRIFRILPPFYLILVTATLFAILGLVPANGSIELRPSMALAFHYGNYWFVYHGSGGVAAGTPVYWSLAVEEHFYLLFPLLFLASRRIGLKGRSQALLFLSLCACILAWRCLLVLGMGVPIDRTYLASDTRFDSILFGCALAVALNPVVDEPWGSDGLWKKGLLPASVALLLFTFIYRAGWFRESVRYTLQGIALVPVFVTAMRFPTWGPFRILNQKHVAFFGELTYSLYLVHHVALYAVHHRLPGWHPIPLSLLALAISVAVALGMYQYVEKPFGRLRKRIAAA